MSKTYVNHVTIGGYAGRRQWNEHVFDPPGWTNMNTASSFDNTVFLGDSPFDWKRRLRLHLPATSALSVTCRKSSMGSVLLDMTREIAGAPTSSVRSQVRGNYSPAWQLASTSVASYASAQNAALMDFVRRAKSTQRSMQGGVFIGEIREVLHMIRNPFRLLYKGQFDYLRFLRSQSRRFRDQPLKKKRKFVADSWLEWSFGWRPLVSDIEDGVKALVKLSEQVPPTKRVTGKAGRQTQAVIQGATPFSILHFQGMYATHSEEEVSIRYHGGVSVNPPTVASQFGLTWSDAIPTIWELIPYSFLVDYFTNLGEIIEAASFNQAAVRWIELGTKLRCSFVEELSGVGPQPAPLGWQNVVHSMHSSWVNSNSYEAKSRTGVTGMSLTPALEFQIPGLGTKWLNLAALASTHKRSYRSMYG